MFAFAGCGDRFQPSLTPGVTGIKEHHAQMSQLRPERRVIEQESNLSSPILKLARSLVCMKQILIYLFPFSRLSTGEGDGNLCS